jgi:hypothetical protein
MQELKELSVRVREGDGSEKKVVVYSFSLVDIVKQLAQRYPTITDHIRRATIDAQHARAPPAPSYTSMCSGSVYQQHPLLKKGKALALSIFFDFISTASNAIGPAASKKRRKWAVILVSVSNVPFMQLSKRFIFPVAIMPESEYSVIGFDKFFRKAVSKDLDLLYRGAALLVLSNISFSFMLFYGN